MVVVAVEVAGAAMEAEDPLLGTSIWEAKELQEASIVVSKSISTLHPQATIATEPCSPEEDKVVITALKVAIMVT